MTEEKLSNVGRKNIYICEKCRHATVTIDVDSGVTPFQIICMAPVTCTGSAYSTMYRAPTTLSPAAEWFRPRHDDPELRDKATAEYVENGGLFIRRIQTERQKQNVKEAVVASLKKSMS